MCKSHWSSCWTLAKLVVYSSGEKCFLLGYEAGNGVIKWAISKCRISTWLSPLSSGWCWRSQRNTQAGSTRRRVPAPAVFSPSLFAEGASGPKCFVVKHLSKPRKPRCWGITETVPNKLNKRPTTYKSHASESNQAISCLKLDRKFALVSYPVLHWGGLSWGFLWRAWCWRHEGAAWTLAPICGGNPWVSKWAHHPAVKQKLSLVVCLFNQLVVPDRLFPGQILNGPACPVFYHGAIPVPSTCRSRLKGVWTEQTSVPVVQWRVMSTRDVFQKRFSWIWKWKLLNL